jgi:TonB family protein
VIGGIIGSVPTAAPPHPDAASLPTSPQRIPAVEGTSLPNCPNCIRVGGDAQQAKLVRQPNPAYPPLAKQARVEGTVKLDAVIARDGTIQNLKVVSGHPLLVPAALEAVKQWVYQPTIVNGEAVEVVTQINVNFALFNSDIHMLRSQGIGMCLDVRGASGADGVAVQGLSCHGSANQQWEVKDSGQIVNKNSGKCLDVPDPSGCHN